MNAAGRIRLLTYTTLYPNQARPFHGLFVKSRLDAIARHCDVTVVAPVDLRALWRELGRVHRSQRNNGIEVLHPRFALFPRIWKQFDGAWLYGQTYPQIRGPLQARIFDLVDAHYAYPDGYAAARLSRRRGVPLVLSVRGSDIQVLAQDPRRRRPIQETLQQAAATIAVSRALARRVVELGADPATVHVIPNGIDRTRFHPVDRSEARKQLGWDPAERVVLWVGRFDPIKGLDLLLGAIQELARRGVATVRCRLVGDGPHRSALEEETRKRGMKESVVFQGPVTSQELRYWYSAADVFCLPSLNEGCPNVVLESLACGTPVVATAVGGVPDLVRDGEDGYLLPNRDSCAAADVLARAMARSWDPGRLAASPVVRGWDEVALAQISVYQTSLGQRPAQTPRPFSA